MLWARRETIWRSFNTQRGSIQLMIVIMFQKAFTFAYAVLKWHWNNKKQFRCFLQNINHLLSHLNKNSILCNIVYWSPCHIVKHEKHVIQASNTQRPKQTGFAVADDNTLNTSKCYFIHYKFLNNNVYLNSETLYITKRLNYLVKLEKRNKTKRNTTNVSIIKTYQ